MDESNVKDLKELIGTTVNKYTITRYISSGSFGNVFEAVHKPTGDIVALKIPIKTKERDGLPALMDEARVYKHISNPERGIANMKIVKSKDTKIIVMDLLGESLESLLGKSKRFGMKTIILLAMSMIDIIKHVHSCGYIHRDIKPDNFAIGYTESQKLYCIDFGLSKKYLKRNGNHIDFSDKKRFCGTARYASIAAHMNQEQSRKDDLESIAYILIYMYKGKLPWQGIKHKEKKERYKLIGEKKTKVTPEVLCKDMPKEFVIFLKYVRNLDFDEKPHYSALKKMFFNLYRSRSYKNDKLEWEK
jgi:serine/threonine protein kinase